MSTRKVHGKRSFTGNHPLLPAMRPAPSAFVPKIPTYSFLKWTFGRGSVIWKIWPAVLLHTLFAACVVYIWVATGKTLEIPNVMLTVMGVVIGFVISYRAISGYDRYWLGRTAWSDVIRNARTMGRLIWYHVPPHLTAGRIQRPPQELAKVMAEKRMALDLVEAFAVALKHHLRGELGIYYEDLYDLVRPLHDFAPATPRPAVPPSVPTPPEAAASGVAPPLKATHAAKRPAASSSSSSADLLTSEPTPVPAATLSIAQQTARHSASASTASLHLPLLPASNPAPEDGVLRRVSPDVIPFAGLFASLGGFWRKSEGREGVKKRDRSSRMRTWSGPIHPQGVAQLEEFEKGENLPEEVLRCLSEWLSVLEERTTVPGTSLAAMLTGVQAFESSLTTLEQVLTTPLPFVYSVHIRHVVWLYLFLLPLQLVSDFVWHTIPAVSVGAFVYLGFVAAGEEIEQPFGYDDNDLDLDMFTRDIIRPDIQRLKRAPCLNAWFPPAPTPTPPPASTSAPTASPDAGAPANFSPGANGDAGSRGAGAASLGLGTGGYANLGTGGYAYGSNIYRASLASLSDVASIVEGDDEYEVEVEVEVDAETGAEEAAVEEDAEDLGDVDADGEARDVREAELVDVR